MTHRVIYTRENQPAVGQAAVIWRRDGVKHSRMGLTTIERCYHDISGKGGAFRIRFGLGEDDFLILPMVVYSSYKKRWETKNAPDHYGYRVVSTLEDNATGVTKVQLVVAADDEHLVDAMDYIEKDYKLTKLGLNEWPSFVVADN